MWDVGRWNQIFSWAPIVLGILTALASAGALVTRNIVAQQQQQKIQQLSPRTLSAQQSQELRRIIQTRTGKIGIATRLMDGESADYGEMIVRVFQDAGWQMVPPIRTLLADFPGKVTLVGTDSSLAPLGDFIANALSSVGIPCEPIDIQPGQIGGGLQPNTVYLAIGRKG